MPIIDGDLGDWWVEEEYWIDASVLRHELGWAHTDTSDFDSRICIGWSHYRNRILVAEQRYDDWFQRLDIEQSPWFGDLFSLQFDGDHGGEIIWPSSKDDPAELYLGAQSYGLGWGSPRDEIFAFPQGNPWFTGPDYVEVAQRFEPDGYGGGWTYTESS